jgi:hypothetical protein
MRSEGPIPTERLPDHRNARPDRVVKRRRAGGGYFERSERLVALSKIVAIFRSAAGSSTVGGNPIATRSARTRVRRSSSVSGFSFASWQQISSGHAPLLDDPEQPLPPGDPLASTGRV